MRSCIYGTQVSETEVACENHHNLIHSGLIPIDLCDMCPFVVARGDFFSATSALSVKLQRSGDYVANPKACGDCPEVKRRDAPASLQFVWPYWSGGANGDEIRFSVRSVERHFKGKVKTLIIGDRPPWYSGPYLRKDRLGKANTNRRYRDTLSKLFWMATKPEVESEFVWMMDDVYFLRPFSVEDLRQPRAEAWRPSSFNSWQRVKTDTMAVLAGRERSTHDYATHLPHYVEKEKLAALFEEFNLHENTLLWEVLYGNTYRSEPIHTKPFLSRFARPRNLNTLRNLTKKATVLNHTSSSWSSEMREFLLECLPEMASCEIEEGLKTPTFKKKRIVKRRPVETHLGYVKAEQ